MGYFVNTLAKLCCQNIEKMLYFMNKIWLPDKIDVAPQRKMLTNARNHDPAD